MNSIKYFLKTIVLSGFIVLIISAPSFASIAKCVGEGTDFPGLSIKESDEYTVYCTAIKDANTGEVIYLYGKSSGDCQNAGKIAVNPSICERIDAETNYDNDISNDNNSSTPAIIISVIAIILSLANAILTIILFKKKKN